MGSDRARRAGRRLLGGAVAVALVGLLALVAERVLELHVHGLTGVWADLLRAVIVLTAGTVVTRLVDGYAVAVAREGGMAGRQLTTLRYLGRFALALIVVLGVLAAFGVGLSSLVFGGAFLTVVVGLAGQTVFGNLLAGLVLLIFHPFSIGDRIAFMTWQYPVLMPSYPHEATAPVYVGAVRDLNLLYTHLELDSGLPMAIPNGIVLQAAVMNHARASVRILRVRFEVDATVDAARAADAVAAAVRRLPGIFRQPEPSVTVADLAATSRSLLVKVAVAPTASEDDARHAVLVAAAEAVRSLTVRQEDPD
jgi:small conductance mechanosensitive channel